MAGILPTDPGHAKNGFVAPLRGKAKAEVAKVEVAAKPNIAEDEEPVELCMNKFGNTQDPETLFVFKEVDEGMVVFGKQDPNTGAMLEISYADRKYMRQNSWRFVSNEEYDTDVDTF